MLRHATARKRDFVLGGNFHSNTYVLNRITNLISTEDGVEPVADGAGEQRHPRDRTRSSIP